MANWSQILLIVRWLLSKGDVLPQLLAVAERFKAADTISEYFAVGEELFRILSVESVDFPDLTAMMSADESSNLEEVMQGEAAAAGRDRSKVIDLAKMVLEFIEQFANRKVS